MRITRGGTMPMHGDGDPLGRMWSGDIDFDMGRSPIARVRLGPEREVLVRSTALARPWMIDGYLHGFEAAFARTPEFFNWINEDCLRRSNATLIVVTDRGQAISGAFCTIEDGRTILFQGVWTSPAFRGLGLAPLGLAVAALAENQAHDRALASAAFVRIMPDGQCNEPSRRCFANRLGFEEAVLLTKAIRGDDQDRHLFASAEPGGTTFRALRMTCQPAILARQADKAVAMARQTQPGRAA